MFLDGNSSQPNIDNDQETRDPFQTDEQEFQSSPVRENGEEGDYILAQTYDLEHLSETVEYQIASDYTEVRKESTGLPSSSSIGMKMRFGSCPEVEGNSIEPSLGRLSRESIPESTSSSGSLNSPKSPKDLERKSKSPKNKSVSNRSRRNEGRKTRESVPSSGYYLVVHHAIEECPMCYAELCPSRFTLNVNTFLLSTICTGCELVINIKIDPPNGSSNVSVTKKVSKTQ